MVARAYGPLLYGAYATATGYANLATLVPDWGLNLLIVKEGARSRQILPSLVRLALKVKNWLSLLALLVVWLVAASLRYDSLTVALVVVVTAGTLAANYQQTYYAAFLAEERNHLAAVVTAAVGVLALVGTAVPVALGSHLLVATAGGAVGGSIAVIAAAAWWRREQAHAGSSPLASRLVLRQAAPFALAGILYYVYFRIDIVMLSLWRPAAEVGWYNAAYRLVSVLYFIPGAICAALFSRLSRLAGTDRALHVEYVSQMARVMSSMAVPLVAAVVGGAGLWIAAIFGKDYSASAPLLAVLGWFLLLQSVSFPMGDALSTSDRQGQRVAVMGGAAILNIVLNIFWIPTKGPMGAAWSTLVTEAFVATGYWLLLFLKQREWRLIVGLIPAAAGASSVLLASSVLSSHGLSTAVRGLGLLGAGTVAVAIANVVPERVGMPLFRRSA